MANMSYCRFRNTSQDLYDCLNALDPYENNDPIKKEEVQAGVRMFNRFLVFCSDMGIIEEFNENRITEVFEECNATIHENNGE